MTPHESALEKSEGHSNSCQYERRLDSEVYGKGNYYAYQNQLEFNAFVDMIILPNFRAIT